MQMGDVRMRQFKRNLRMLREAVKADPNDKDMLRQYHDLNKERLAFELAEWRERADHVPTDLNIKYELGVRLWESKKYDEAIMAFQEAQNNPKHRVDAMHFLGRSFLFLGMKPEAVETLKRSIDEYELATTGDKKSKELHYWYARALEENKQTSESIDVYSKVVQWDIGYLDARKRMNELRAQVAK
jgi:tetratricopeptide (TPR) repeat protein